MKITKQLRSIITDYRYIWKNGNELCAMKAEMPFKDEDDVDVYQLYKYDKIEIEDNCWYSVEELLKRASN